MVKKEYVKPEMVVEQFMAEIAFLDASTGNGSGTIPGGGSEEGGDGDFSNDRRGGWGDLWN